MRIVLPDYYQRLELDTQADEREAKRAYAKKLKKLDISQNPEAFGQLRQDLENTLNHIRQGWGFYIEPDLVQPKSEGFEKNISADKKEEEEETPDSRIDSSEQHSPEKILAELHQRIAACAPHDMDAARKVFDHLLENTGLIGIENKNKFELLVANAICQKSFKNHSGLVFLVAAEKFDWKRGYGSSLLEKSETYWELTLLLEQLSLLSQRQKNEWLFLSQTSSDSESDFIESINIEEFNDLPQLSELMIGKERIKKWQIYKSHENKEKKVYKKYHDESDLESEVINPSSTSIFDIGKILKGKIPIYIAFLFGIFLIFFLSNAETNSNNDAMVKCDALLASQISKDWQAVPGEDLSQLINCYKESSTLKIGPLFCEDVENLTNIIDTRNRIINSSQTRFFYSSINDFVLYNTNNEINYIIKNPGSDYDCQKIMAFVANGNWLYASSEKEAKAVVETAYHCSKIDPAYTTQPYNLIVMNFLTRLDAWPENNKEKVFGSIPLKNALVPVEILNYDSSIDRDINAKNCVRHIESIALSDSNIKSLNFRKAEFLAIQEREKRRSAQNPSSNETSATSNPTFPMPPSLLHDSPTGGQPRN